MHDFKLCYFHITQEVLYSNTLPFTSVSEMKLLNSSCKCSIRYNENGLLSSYTLHFYNSEDIINFEM